MSNLILLGLALYLPSTSVSSVFTLSNPVPWQNWMVAYLGYTLRMRTLFRGWPIMVNDTHTRRRRRWCYIYKKIFAHILLFTFYWAMPGGIGPWPEWLTIILQCYGAVGRATWPVKSAPKWPIYCVEWDVKPYITTPVLITPTGYLLNTAVHHQRLHEVNVACSILVRQSARWPKNEATFLKCSHL